ncbi:MAG: DHH family phosphoesterase [Caldilineaceae bacterium]
MNDAPAIGNQFEKTFVRLQQLDQFLNGADHLLILPHNNPDPDAIASALALKFLAEQRYALSATIAYQGIVGRAENRALVRYLRYPMKRLTPADFAKASHLALVDTQPGAGNNPLPPTVTPGLVLDHHEYRTASDEVAFTDIRPQMGATSSILVEYLRCAELEIAPSLATALFYGVKTDTQGLERKATESDREAFCHLLQFVDLEALFKIERAQLPGDYFRTLAQALRLAKHYDDVMIAFLGEVSYPDLAANIAELLMRHQGTRWVICAGVYKDALYISVRTNQKRGAGQLIQQVVGKRGRAGGHGSMAGAQVPLAGDNAETLMNGFINDFLSHLDRTGVQAGRPFI